MSDPTRYEPWLRMEDGSIAGWMGYAPFWEKAIASAPPGAVLVEVGVFCGLSLIELGKMAKAADKGLRVVGVDTFAGSTEHQELLAHLPNGTLVREAWNNLDRAGVLPDVTIVVSDSVAASRLFQDFSVHAVFLDGDHSEDGVSRDIGAWWPKVRSNGLLGGDDVWVFPGVKAAVTKMFPLIVLDEAKCWWEIDEDRP